MGSARSLTCKDIKHSKTPKLNLSPSLRVIHILTPKQ
jgi:hypothetical protein